MNKKLQPNKTVKRLVCPKCGELMVKIYPWSSIDMAPGVTGASLAPCKKCVNKLIK